MLKLSIVALITAYSADELNAPGITHNLSPQSWGRRMDMPLPIVASPPMYDALHKVGIYSKDQARVFFDTKLYETDLTFEEWLQGPPIGLENVTRRLAQVSGETDDSPHPDCEELHKRYAECLQRRQWRYRYCREFEAPFVACVKKDGQRRRVNELNSLHLDAPVISEPDATEMPSSVIVNTMTIPEGSAIVVQWNDKPVWIVHRNQKMIDQAAKDDHVDMRDPQDDSERVHDKKWLVAMAVGELGCIPLFNAGNYGPGGFFDPCIASHYDSSGRARKGPALSNLQIPKYIIEDDKITIGNF